MIKIKILKSIFVLLFPLSCFSQTVEWLINDGTEAMERATSIVADNASNIYITGGYIGETQIGNFLLPDYGNENIFVCKYDFAGNVIWAVSAGGSNQDVPMSIITDSECNVYVTGFYNQNISFGDTSFIVPENDQVFLAKYDSSGVFQWAAHGGSNSQNWGKSIIVDSEDNIYIAGNIGANATFGDTTVLASYSFFIAKYSNDGDLLKIISSESHADINAICCDQNNYIYATGGFNGELSLNGNTVNNDNTNNDFFVARFNPSLENLWIFDAGADLTENGTSICVDNNNEICFTYLFEEFTSLNGNDYYSNGDNDLMLGKMGSEGNLIWNEQLGGTNLWHDKTLVVDQQNNIYLAGSFYGTDFFGGNAFTSQGNSDLFIIKYNQSGEYQWLLPGGGEFQDIGGGILVDDYFNMYFTGHFNSPMEIGGIELIGSGGLDYFLCKIANIVGVSKEKTETVISVFPNPTNGLATIKSLPSEKPLIVTLFDLQGKELKSIKTNGDQIKLNLNDYKTGIYLLKIDNENGESIGSYKLLKKEKY